MVSSVVGTFGTPLRSSYAASKHALHGWFDSLRAELHDGGIRATLVCPGFVRTNVAKNALTADGQPMGTEGQRKGIAPKRCATAIADAIERETGETYVRGWETIGVYAKRFSPGSSAASFGGMTAPRSFHC